MNHRKLEQWGAAAGIGSVAMIVVGMFLPGTIPVDANAQGLQTFMVEHHDEMLIQSALVGGGVLLFLMFLATLRNVLRRTETDTGELSAVMSGSALIALTMILVAVAGSAGILYRSAGAVDPNTARMAFDSMAVLFAFSGVPTAVFAGTAAVLQARVEIFPAWLRGVGWVAAAGNALMPLTIFFTKGAWSPLGVMSFVPTLVFFVFIVGTAGALTMHPEAGEARMPARAFPMPA